MVQAITDNNFDKETGQGVVLTDFWATWCGPCRMQSPVVEQLDEDENYGSKVKFTKMDVDANPETAQNFGIMSIPTLMVKKDGQVVETLVGYHTKDQLQQVLDQYTD
ncbi:thioredoxin [Loigolactobacillus rennini]|uniref:Thioredoxin n=2 Tax=Loigolactobacillus rennini TaxID=238013 RepID=A0A0R2D6V9_9LACO|nr:thioredoxin [Loigolactobacillus rennini]KRM95715.1 thiol-disulfide isomerase and thioredoxin [Loigolactobacillus rennini DSM 20253]SFZ88367.1 Thioredoxin [Loigolactobacillus rennini]